MNNNEDILKRIKVNEIILKQFEDEYAKKLNEFENVKLQYQLKINELQKIIKADKELLEYEQS